MFHLDSEDYIGGIFSLVLPQGESQVCFNLTIVDDAMPEPTETFFVFLNNLEPGVDNNAAMATVQIINDDGEKTCIYLLTLALCRHIQ